MFTFAVVLYYYGAETERRSKKLLDDLIVRIAEQRECLRQTQVASAYLELAQLERSTLESALNLMRGGEYEPFRDGCNELLRRRGR